MAQFDLDAFIASVNNDRSATRSNKDRLNKVLMNTRKNQGINTFIPIISEKLGNIYLKMTRVYEYWGTTSLIDKGEAWYRIMPLPFYGGLSDEDLDLYNEVKGYLDELQDNEEVEMDEFRVRNYSLFFGINRSLKNSSNEDIEDYVDCPCVFVYPSINVIDQLSTSINAKCDAMKGNEWLSYVITPANTGREGVMQISYTKSTGVGYDTSVNFEMNTKFNKIIDPDMEISNDTIKLFDDPIPLFLGWIYDSQGKSYFNRTAFKELKDQLKKRVESMYKRNSANAVASGNDSSTYENKNNLGPSAVPSNEKSEYRTDIGYESQNAQSKAPF